MLRAAWEEAFIAPTDPANNTGLWLLPHSLTTDIYRAVRLFEDFSHCVGANVFNPARLLNERTAPNPAIELAQEMGFDLVSDLAVLAETSEGSPEYAGIEQRLIGLVPALREKTGASTAIGDQDLLNAICQPEMPVAIQPSLDSFDEAEQIRLLRSNLKPHINECCTDADLLEAARNPNGPLFASGLCRVQCLYRNIYAPLPEAMTFSAEVLGRNRIHAKCWYDCWPEQDRKPDVIEPAMALAA